MEAGPRALGTRSWLSPRRQGHGPLAQGAGWSDLAVQVALAAGAQQHGEGAGEAVGASILDSRAWHESGAIPGL